MKIILSRKGFDSEYGAQASPFIKHDRTLLSLPIPADDKDTERFSNLNFNKKTYFEIISELNPKTKIKVNDYCHLDPDLNRKNQNDREKGWLPLFGQSDKAQGHLRNNNIGEGDLFLFFGWFKETEWVGHKLQYKKDAPDQHIIWGYLEIGKIYNIEEMKTISELPRWAHYHSHAQKNRLGEPNNRLYIATKSLSLVSTLPGGGCFNYNDRLVLTKKGASKRSHWELPQFFKNKQIEITYHSKSSYQSGYFQSVAKGQEFVITDTKNKDVEKWAKKLIEVGTKG